MISPCIPATCTVAVVTGDLGQSLDSGQSPLFAALSFINLACLTLVLFPWPVYHCIIAF